METSLSFSCLLIFGHLVLAHSADLFLSIDCGSSSSYNDPVGYTWTGDTQYVQTGQNAKVRSTASVSQPLTTLRYFPTGKKNCYTINGTSQGTKVMVRADFYYGNYDGQSSPPMFDLLLDANYWTSITTYLNQTVPKEVIYITDGDTVSVCLGRSQSNSVPFISSLEIRTLDPDGYKDMDPKHALLTFTRRAFGSTDVVRYPDDIYDRIWYPYTGSSGVVSVTSTRTDISTSLNTHPPVAAMLHAITPASNSTTSMLIPLPNLPSQTLYYYFNLYFAEVIPNVNRSFSVYDGTAVVYNGPEIPPWGTVNLLYATKYSLSSASELSLVRKPTSALPPLINGAEFFLLSNELTNGTADTDAKALSKFQKNYPQLQAWSGDPCLPAEYQWEWLNCSSIDRPRITALYLSGYGLTGSLADFSALTALQIIDLHNNSLSGTVPDFLGQLPNLQALNLADNLFTGSLPQSLVNNPRIKLNISGNRLLPIVIPRKHLGPAAISGIVVGSVLLLVLLCWAVICITCFCRRKKRQNNYWTFEMSAGPNVAPPESVIESETNRCISYAEIMKITDNFSRRIGKGGSAVVYHGRFQNGQEVAVKMITDLMARGVKEFETEVMLLVKVHHNCLIKCLGYCQQQDNLILLYEYMSGGNLRELLSGKSRMSVFLSWEKRLEAAVNVATGLDYLHSGCEPPIIHRDVKSANILLDERLEAKLADFGLCKIVAKDDVTFISTVVAGTPGYIDPEYYRTNLLTKRSDVYSFGVVLFELMSGYPAVFKSGNQKTSLVYWATEKIVTGDIHGVIDSNLRGQYDVNSMWRVADIARSCTSESSKQRPTMTEVVKQLKEALDTATNKQMPQFPITEFAPPSTSEVTSGSSSALLSSPLAR